jgi:uncharacterized membrane protein YbhN (UPF0104 family)
MRRSSWLRLLAGVAILGLVVWRVGTGPFVDGIRSVDARSLVIASLIALPTTLCCAWRWRLVARGLGVPIALPAATAAYYRSQFLNTTLPGGVLGDVHRGLSHGREVNDTSHALRAVAWERVAGQVVQVPITLGLLLLLPSPLGSSVPGLVAVVLALGLVVLVAGRRTSRTGTSLWARTSRAARSDLRLGLLDRRAWPGVVVVSVLAMTGHVATFLVAARTAGTHASLAVMVPLALLVLLAMAIPANVAGWGPREGVAAWAFGAAGLGASQGVATAVVFGVMVFVASLPGAVVLLVAWLRTVRARHVPAPAQPRPRTLSGSAHG